MRIDKLLVDRGLVDSRERAQALIMAGDVLVGDRPVLKAGARVDIDAAVRLRRPEHPFVSRGGVKLAGALEALAVNPQGRICVDIGSSTGGFTHCLLLAGAERVYAVDVDIAQLDWKLQKDPRVIQIEGNARYLEQAWITERPELITVDVSFISLTKILPATAPLLDVGGICLALVKPQFELGREKVSRGGIVTDSGLHEEAIATVVCAAVASSLRRRTSVRSSITGKEGNQEFFVLFEKI